MEKFKKTVWLFCIVLCSGLLSCNKTDDAESVKYKFSDLQFAVTVNSMQNGTRSGLHKQEWEKGDRIAMAIDGVESNVAFLEYIGNGDWTVSPLDDNTHFSDNSGTLAAVYAEKLNYEAGNITTAGDVLYTQSGTYEIRGNIAHIRLNMSERPVSRIAVVGLLPTYWIDGMVEYTKLISLVSMNWDTSVNSKGENSRTMHGDTCVYYGILPPDNAGSTVINLVNPDGAYHKRIYEGKQVQKGDFIILNGPGTDEKAQWESVVPVKGIEAVKASVELWIGEKGNLSDWYFIVPSDAMNKKVSASSSNMSVLNIDENISYEAVAKGSSSVTITSDDGGYSCKIDVRVKSVADYVKIQKWGIGTEISDGVWYTTIFKITNSSPENIELKSLAGVDISSYGIVESGKDIEVKLYSRMGYINGTVNLVFLCKGVSYTISTNG